MKTVDKFYKKAQLNLSGDQEARYDWQVIESELTLLDTRITKASEYYKYSDVNEKQAIEGLNNVGKQIRELAEHLIKLTE